MAAAPTTQTRTLRAVQFVVQCVPLLSPPGFPLPFVPRQVMQAARRLALIEDAVPYDALLGALRTAYSTAQSQLMFASSRTKVPVQPVLRELLARENLLEWKEELKDLMTVLGTAAHVNRRRSMRALAKLQYLSVEEVCNPRKVSPSQILCVVARLLVTEMTVAWH